MYKNTRGILDSWSKGCVMEMKWGEGRSYPYPKSKLLKDILLGGGMGPLALAMP